MHVKRKSSQEFIIANVPAWQVDENRSSQVNRYQSIDSGQSLPDRKFIELHRLSSIAISTIVTKNLWRTNRIINSCSSSLVYCYRVLPPLLGLSSNFSPSLVSFRVNGVIFSLNLSAKLGHCGISLSKLHSKFCLPRPRKYTQHHSDTGKPH